MTTFTNALFIAGGLLCFSMFSLNVEAESTTVAVQTEKQASSGSATIVINSRVKGSQEQPNVTYIMPWQGINKPIMINGKQQKVVMPTFKPINPKDFKKRVEHYYQQHK